MRPSKNFHVIALLRQEMNLLQKTFADRIGVHEKTVQGIELNTRKLSRVIAERISLAFNADLQMLLDNDTTGLRTRDGKPWTSKTRQEIEERIQRWGDLEPMARAAQMASVQTLLLQYLKVRHFFNHLLSPEADRDDVLAQWCQLHGLVFATLMEIHGNKEMTWKDFQHNLPLKVVIDDVLGLKANERTWVVQSNQLRKTLKAEVTPINKKLQQSRRQAYAELFGWNERGLEAYALAEELGWKTVEEMKIGDFTRLLWERLAKQGKFVPARFDPVAAVNSFNDKVIKTLAA